MKNQRVVEKKKDRKWKPKRYSFSVLFLVFFLINQNMQII